MESIRLNKYISESGLCSRREADRFIETGVVFINGKRAKMGDQVLPTDAVKVNGMLIEPKPKEEAIYIAFNKPVGITCTTAQTDPDNIIDFIRFGERIFPIGRLDKDSQGLIFLTSNGDIVNKILRAGNNHEKEYLVTVNKPITDQFIKGMANGVPVLGQTTKKCVVERINTYVFKIILVQGLNRQIRRMCEHFGFEVQKLERIRIMNVKLDGIPVGTYRELTEKELKGIFEMVKNSSKTAAVPKATPKVAPKPTPTKPKTTNNPDFRKRTTSKTGFKPAGASKSGGRNKGKR
jgi:23S rRNA pseudouridine2604 synthase